MMSKVRFRGRIEWERDVEIKNEADPYEELSAMAEQLAREDGFVDSAYIEVVKITPTQSNKDDPPQG